MNEYNQKAITDVYKNAHIALQSISDLIPSIKSEEFKKFKVIVSRVFGILLGHGDSISEPQSSS